MDVASLPFIFEEEQGKLPLGDLATWILHQIYLQVPDELLKPGILLDPFLKPSISCSSSNIWHLYLGVAGSTGTPQRLSVTSYRGWTSGT